MSVTYGSVCSGIESASVAWEPLDMVPQWFSEIEQFPSAVLRHRWPSVPNLGDMTRIKTWISSGLVSAPEILVGTLDTECGYQSQAFQTVAAGHVLPIHDKATRHMGVTGKGSGNGLGVGKPGDPCPTLTTGDKHAVSVAENQRGKLRTGGTHPALTSGGGKPGQGYAAALVRHRVRKLVPVECERLRGFPDNHTRVPYRNKPAGECPDGPQYKAIGNSKAVPVVQWVGRRLLAELERCEAN